MTKWMTVQLSGIYREQTVIIFFSRFRQHFTFSRDSMKNTLFQKSDAKIEITNYGTSYQN